MRPRGTREGSIRHWPGWVDRADHLDQAASRLRAIHPEAEAPLRAFHHIVRRTDFASFAHLRQTFPNADLVGKATVFNIGGHKFRLVAAIHYDRRKVFIRHVLTHQDYDRIHWLDG